MVKGLEKFREYFKDFNASYIIIGGTACDIAIDEAGLKPRATKDIDIILIVEALSKEFVAQFWKFIESGGYEIKEKGEKDRKYYRFIKPSDIEFPFQIEIFSKNPDLLDLKDGSHVTPVPVAEGSISLSAILLQEEYYIYTIDHSRDAGGLRIANIEALICLKAKAFLDLKTRRASGEEISDKEIRKHKLDVFRMTALLSQDEKFTLPGRLKRDLQNFSDQIKTELPENSIFKEMGLAAIDVKKLYVQLLKNFSLRI